MNWREFLTPLEVAELAQIAAQKDLGQAMQRRIYDRCRKRKNKSERENRL